MAGYIGNKVVKACITLWLIVTVAFLATRISGDAMDFIMPEGLNEEAREAMTSYLGLDKSWLEQYWLYARSVFHGDLGISFHFRQPVIRLYAQRFIPTLMLCGLAMLLSMIVSIPLGVIAALKKNKPTGFFIQSFAFLGYAVPNFVLAILLILVFSFHLGWLPSGGSETVWHYIMPVAALACTLIASLTRFSRSAMLDVLSQDYIRTARAAELIEIVGLRTEHLFRFPHEFSGGQRQRISIARALALNPEFILADEAVSALDVSLQAQIINLLVDMQRKFSLTMLFITHDLSVVEYLCDRIAVLYMGRVVEVGRTKDLCSNPAHPYSQVLLSAIPSVDPRKRGRRVFMRGERFSPYELPETGCVFVKRCPQGRPECSSTTPTERVLPGSADHKVTCHFA